MSLVIAMCFHLLPKSSGIFSDIVVQVVGRGSVWVVVNFFSYPGFWLFIPPLLVSAQGLSFFSFYFNLL